MAEAASFGVIGIGVMGSNLARNVRDHGFPVAVWDLDPGRTQKFVDEERGRAVGAHTLAELIAALERPRRILAMVPAGAPVDDILAKLRPLLAPGDIVIDGGNSWFEDTVRREREMTKAGFNFVGMGVSGGEEGARHGPSLMPGGNQGAWERLKPVLEKIAAHTDAGPCVTHVGPDGAGHFVKMVHNGIEYGDMQLIAEIYDVLRRGLALAPERIAEIFRGWNQGPLASFLVEVTAKVLTVKAPRTDSALVDLIVDKAGQKGTGKWTVKIAAELGVAVPTIAAAVDARILSAAKEERVAAAAKLRGPSKKAISGDPERHLLAAHDALLAARICAYAQGLRLIETASNERNWKIDLAEIARIWKGGCIIRSALLDVIRGAYSARKRPPNLLMARDVARSLNKAHRGLRKIVAAAAGVGVAVPALSASLAYLDGYRTEHSPANLIQAQRDAFGAHTYERTDMPGQGPFHTEWLRG